MSLNSFDQGEQHAMNEELADAALAGVPFARCEACPVEWLTSVPPAMLRRHEQRDHGGVQTVWTFDERGAS